MRLQHNLVLRPHADPISRRRIDEGFGGDPDIGSAALKCALHGITEFFAFNARRLCGLGPDFSLPLRVTTVLGFALKDDIAPREIVGRSVATFPADAAVLAAIRHGDLQRHFDAAKRDTGLSGFDKEKAAQQGDELLARKILDLVWLDGEHRSAPPKAEAHAFSKEVENAVGLLAHRVGQKVDTGR